MNLEKKKCELTAGNPIYKRKWLFYELIELVCPKNLMQKIL